ncbi:uncharacterized protein LOC143855387 [Tasmannia lanceolata]|uniref:uncharacterized protein LOC143855387 n=1 Tax=Tasmannia lanceolata TaxID=3420 RepID=UPI0040647EE8
MSSSGGASSIGSTPARSDDPAWAYGLVIPSQKNCVKCTFCEKLIKGGGITRFKEHLAGVPGDVAACKKVNADVKWRMSQMLGEMRKEGARKSVSRAEVGSLYAAPEEEDVEEGEGDEDDEPMGPPQPRNKGKAVVVEPSGAKRKKKGLVGGLRDFFAPRTTPGSQPSIKSALATKETLDRADMAVGMLCYDANLPFNVANSPYWQPMFNAINAVGSGVVFLKSVNASGVVKNAEALFAIFDEIVLEVGPENVVQFITDSEPSYKAAGKKLEIKYATFFWTPCAAHCLDLILEHLGKPYVFPLIGSTIDRARKITRFIYNHAALLNLMRQKFTGGRDLCRPAWTRFATNFISIQSLVLHRKALQQMFVSDEYTASRYIRHGLSEEIVSTVLDKQFWDSCKHILNISKPLVRVLHLVDRQDKPAMGYIYEAMDRAKENIKARLKNKKSDYAPIKAFFTLLSFSVLLNSLRSFIMFLANDPSKCLTIIVSFTVAWWNQFGNDVPDLQSFAVRILSQTCSATGCERNWSTFEHIHSAKRNRLEHQRLNDLVFVHYNLKFRERDLNRRSSTTSDPLSIDHLDVMMDWVAEDEDVILTPDDIGWENIEAPSRVDAADDEDEDANLEDTPPRGGGDGDDEGYQSVEYDDPQPDSPPF